MDFDSVKKKLEKGYLDSSILLGSAKFLDAASKSMSAFNDSRHFPFYYHLACQSQARHVIQIGSQLGLIGTCFMQGCKEIESWTVLEQQLSSHPVSIIEANLKIFAPKLASINILDVESYAGSKSYDLGLLTGQYESDLTTYMNLLWDNLESEGLLVVDYIHFDEATTVSFEDFCRVKNRKPIVFNTRYGVGIITR